MVTKISKSAMLLLQLLIMSLLKALEIWCGKGISIVERDPMVDGSCLRLISSYWEIRVVGMGRAVSLAGRPRCLLCLVVVCDDGCVGHGLSNQTVLPILDGEDDSRKGVSQNFAHFNAIHTCSLISPRGDGYNIGYASEIVSALRPLEIALGLQEASELLHLFRRHPDRTANFASPLSLLY